MNPEKMPKYDQIAKAREVSQNKKPDKQEVFALSLRSKARMPRDLTIEEDQTEPSCSTSPGIKPREEYLSRRLVPSESPASTQTRPSTPTPLDSEPLSQTQVHTPPTRLPPYVPIPDSLATDAPDFVRSSVRRSWLYAEPRSPRSFPFVDRPPPCTPPRPPPHRVPVPLLSSPIRLSPRGESDRDSTPTSTHLEFTEEGEIDSEFMKAEMDDWNNNPFNPANSSAGI